jgi:hypothetical protein
VSGHIEKAFEDVVKRIAVVLRAAGRSDHVLLYVVKMGRVELFLTDGFRKVGLDVERLTHFTSIANRAGATDALGEMLQVFVHDMLLMSDDFLPACRAGYRNGNYSVNADELPFHGELMKNVSVGTAVKDAVWFRRYAHNNHLPAQLLRAPADFLPPALARYLDAAPMKRLTLIMEGQSGEVTSVTDLTVKAHAVVNATVGGNLVTLRGGSVIELPVTFDSKVCYDTVAALSDAKKLKQQFEHFVSADRLIILDELMVELGDVHRAAHAEKIGFLDELVPAMFAHYVFTPYDFVDAGGKLASFYQTKMPPMFKDFADMQMEAGKLAMSPDDLDLCIEAVDRFCARHFVVGDGGFINKQSQMRFK